MHLTNGTPNVGGTMKTALCVIAKQENRYLREFCEHYRRLGFDKIFLYDNNDEDGERFEDSIGEYIDNGFVETVDQRGKKGVQMSSYDHCYERHGAEYDWMAFFDVDEFLVFSPESGLSKVGDFLSRPEYASANVVCVNWMCYGDNGKLRYEDKPLAERFPEPLPFDLCISYNFPANCHVKSILRGGRRLEWRVHPHCPFARDGETWSACDTLGRPHGEGAPFQPYSFSVAYLRHYLTKTAEEFADIVNRGYAPHEVDDLFMKCRIETKFFAANMKEPRRLAILAERIPWFKIGFDAPPLLSKLYGERAAFAARCDRIEREKAELTARCARLEESCRLLTEERDYMKCRYEAISGSTCWRLTSPVRAILDVLKRCRRRMKL